jgi:hypothetical protein
VWIPVIYTSYYSFLEHPSTLTKLQTIINLRRNSGTVQLAAYSEVGEYIYDIVKKTPQLTL